MHNSPMRRLLLLGSLTVVCVMTAAEPALGQRRSHTMGAFEYSIDAQDMYNTSSQPEFSFTGTWPQDFHRYGTISYHWNAYAIGRYTNADGVEVLRESQRWPSNAGYREPPEYGLKEFRRVRPPTTVLEKSDGAIEAVSQEFSGEVDPDLPSDAMIELKYKSPPAFEVTKRSYSFANAAHDDYVIQHNQYVVTFDADEDVGPDLGMDTTQVLEDIYFLIAYAFTNVVATNINQTRWYGAAEGDWGDYAMYPSSLVPNSRELLIGYGFDGQHPDIDLFEEGGRRFDNRGTPRHAVGIVPGTSVLPTAEFTASTYAGYATIHADVDGSSGTDDPAQPRTILTNAGISNVWESRFEGYATWWDWAESGTREHAENVPGWPEDPSQRPGSMIFKAYGPYDLVMGDTVNIVYAVGAGGISRDVAEEKGKEWLAWYRGEAGANFDDAAKNDLVASGLDSLSQTLDRANWAWHNDLNVGNPPTSPDLIITEGPNRIALEWTDLAGRFPEVAKYRIYRKRGTFLNDTDEELESVIRIRDDGLKWPDGERRRWEMIAEVPSTENTYLDTEVIRGEPYYYGVTAVDDGTTNNGLFPGPLESSKYTNRSRQPAFSFQPGEGSTDEIRIVPNPFFASGGDFNFSDETNKLLFVNLPPFCTIRIFTVSGNLVKIIEHTSGSADESWDQVTDFNQLAASGVYIMHVSNATDAEGNPLPESINKFSIVR